MDEHVRKFTVDNEGIKDFVETIKHALNLNEGDEIETVYCVNYITVSKKGKRCFLCGRDTELNILGNGRYACKMCLQAIGKALQD